MNYAAIYSALIARAANRVLDGYSERHHAVPLCLGGLNDHSNIVVLTAKEHYTAHHLLTKIYPNNTKIQYAFYMMMVSNKSQLRPLPNGRAYAIMKENRSLSMRGSNNPMFGKPSAFKSHTEETKEKIRLSKLGKKRTPFKRSPPSQETRDKISKANLGRPKKRK